MTRAVFLDRDGTLNAEVGFVDDPARLVVLPGVRPALQRLADAGFRQSHRSRYRATGASARCGQK